MYIKNIMLENFRNYDDQNIELINGINLFVGDNAQGKTNIIESVYLSAFGKSYRAIKDIEVINFEKEYCRITLNYNKLDINKKIEVFIDNFNKKIIKQDEVKINKISEHVGEMLIVIFSPDSLDIVKGSPAKRRNFIDMICSQISKSYYINLQEYMKCLKLKNSMFKNGNIDREYITVLHEKMSEYIFNIVNFRKKIVSKLLEKAKVIQNELTNNLETINLIYISDFINLEKNEIKKILDQYLEIEMMRKMSLKGIQRDDIEIYINEMDVAKFGSQGQNRTALLTLKLANFELLKEENNDEPILLLDDIMSELDSNRIRFLLNYIKKYQSIITTTDDSFANHAENIIIYQVKNGEISLK
ncbi:MAG: DNA replication/repair protein RecF [Clostridia bacterium]|nr:DNA replication/repair protein RecF [Clostridia bacterium]